MRAYVFKMCVFAVWVHVCVGSHCPSLKMQLWKQSLIDCEGMSKHFANYEAKMIHGTYCWDKKMGGVGIWANKILKLLFKKWTKPRGCKFAVCVISKSKWQFQNNVKEQRRLPQWSKDALRALNRGGLVSKKTLNLIYLHNVSLEMVAFKLQWSFKPSYENIYSRPSP